MPKKYLGVTDETGEAAYNAGEIDGVSRIKSGGKEEKPPSGLPLVRGGGR